MMLVLERLAAGSLVDGSLAVGRGETAIVLGPAGSGKTTLLRIVAGFERAVTGRIVLDGEIVTDQPPGRRPMAFVPSEDSLFPELTLADNVAYGLRLRKEEGIQERVAELLGRVGLADHGHRKGASLDFEARWRGALARAAAVEPKVLLVDEPPGDAAVGIALAKSLATRYGGIVVAATADRLAALSLSDRIAFLRQGRVEQVGPPSDVYHRPITPFVADYVARANLIDCMVESTGGGFVLVRLFGRRVGIPSAADAHYEHGEKMLLVARPETFRIVGDGDGFPALVRHAAFLGAWAAYELEIDGQRISVLDTESRGNRLLPVGGETRVGLANETLRLLPYPPGA